MNKITTALIVPVVAVAAVYGGMKGYVYFSTKSNVDELVRQASMFADIEYGGISSDLLKGSVSVKNLLITPRGVNDEIGIREIRLQGDGPGFLFSDTGQLAQQTPEFLNLSLFGLRVGLDGELYRTMLEMQQAQVQADDGLPGKCEFGSSFTADDLRALGYDELYMNASFTVSHDKIENKTRIEANMSVDDMANVDLTASMRGGAAPMMMAMAPAVDEVRLVYSLDSEFMRGSTKYCAAVLNISEADYIEMMSNASDADYQKYYGFMPGPGIREAIGHFLSGSGNFEIRMRPSADMNPAMLSQYRPQDMISLLGMTVYVDGQPVQDLSFSVDESLGGYFGEKSLADEEAGKKDRSEPVKVTYTFQDTPLQQLPQYIGARIRVTTRDGRERTGTLISISQQTARIEQRVHSGKFEALVPLADIDVLQVHRLLKPKEQP